MTEKTLEQLLSELEGPENEPKAERQDSMPEPKPKRRWSRISPLVAIALVVAIIGIAVAAILLFEHNIPAVQAGARITTSCPDTFLVGNSSVVSGAGWVYFGCSVTTPAVRVFLPGPVSLSNPLPDPYYTMYLIPGLPGVAPSGKSFCSGFSGGIQLARGLSVVTLPPAGDYYYCLDYKSLPDTGLPAFTVQWSQ